jgi:ABC-type multidrug transport system fused ATPase/permease subunit
MEQELNVFINQKNEMVEKLINRLKSTNDFYEGNQIALVLTEHFKDDRIENCLVDLIQDPIWKMHNGTLLYALSEYTNNSKYLYFLVDMILNNKKNNDGEIFMGAYSMIISLHPPLDRKEITRSIRRVKREEQKKNISKEQKKLTQSLLNYLEGQREINKFYNQFLV